MGIQLKNNTSGTLATAINASDIGIVLTAGNGANFPVLGLGDYFYATLESTGGTFEVIKVTARSGDSMTVLRAQEGSIANSFAAGSRLELRITAQSVIDTATQYAGDADQNLRNDLAAATGSSLVGFQQGGVSAVLRTTQAKLQQTVSVKDFGAVGDGVADDTAAIQAAMTYAFSIGAELTGVESETYLCGDLSFTIIGQDALLTGLNLKLKAATSASALDIRYANLVRIQNCTFDGNKANQSKHTNANVLLWGCSAVTITDSKFFDGAFHGLWAFKCRNVNIDRNEFYQNGKADSAFPADGLTLTISNGNITNNICYLNNTNTGGDNIDGDGIQLARDGAVELPFWNPTEDLKGVVRLENNLCYSNGRRGIKDQRGNTQVVNNTCYGNYTQFEAPYPTNLENFVWIGNTAGRSGDTYVNPLYRLYVDTAGNKLRNLVFTNNIALGNVTGNDAFRFGGLQDARISDNIYDGTVSAPYSTYSFRDVASDNVYLSCDANDSISTAGGITNFFRAGYSETTITGTGRVQKFEDGTLVVEHYQNLNPSSSAEQTITLPATFVGEYFVTSGTTYNGTTAPAIAAVLSARTRVLSANTVGLSFLTPYVTGGTFRMSFFAKGRWK